MRVLDALEDDACTHAVTRPPRTRSTRVAYGVVVTVAVVIAIATLWPLPAPPRASEPFATRPHFCLSCDEFGGVDFFLNIWLFLPFGAALAAATGRWRVAVGVAFASSLLIECLQLTVLTGREASELDVISNTVGGALGASLFLYRRLLAAPSQKQARILTWLAAAGSLAILAATAALLRPSVPQMALWGQWTPQHLAFEPYSGTVRSFSIDGISVPYQLVPEWSRLRAMIVEGETTARVSFVAGKRPTALAAIARVGSSAQEVLMLGARRHAVIFRTRMAMNDWGLRRPEIALPGALRNPGEEVTVLAGLRARRWYVRALTPRGSVERTVPFSVALGWSFLLPFEYALDPIDRWISALWIAAIVFPAGYWMAFGQSDDRRVLRRLAWGAPMLLLAAGLLLIPYLARFDPAAASEWLALAAGLIGGASVARSVGVSRTA